MLDASGVGLAEFHAEFDQAGQHLIRMVGHHLGKVLDGELLAQEVGRGSLAIGELLRDEDRGDRIGKPDLRSHDTPTDLTIAHPATIRP
ncbi:hypothetical protein ABIB94_007533 [Bradyrhizobium sp. JR7.2]|uniref:hypothetical protein n=1 Tax=Bradyrhizobium TaxID=374 RepID=UPI0024B06C70|nr:hypothetical protein [Bradyrhizobium barranii]WFU00159.1 hypothetical protein QA633_48470 [Bradyrhizobium barranii]